MEKKKKSANDITIENVFKQEIKKRDRKIKIFLTPEEVKEIIQK